MKAFLAIVFLITLAVCAVVPVRADGPFIMGLPRPSVQPTCGAADVGLYGAKGDCCIYSCQNGSRRVISGCGACSFATSTATATPTATATATPTPTATSTP